MDEHGATFLFFLVYFILFFYLFQQVLEDLVASVLQCCDTPIDVEWAFPYFLITAKNDRFSVWTVMVERLRNCCSYYFRILRNSLFAYFTSVFCFDLIDFVHFFLQQSWNFPQLTTNFGCHGFGIWIAGFFTFKRCCRRTFLV